MKKRRIKIIVNPNEPDCVRWIATRVARDLNSLPPAATNGLPKTVVAGTDEPLARAILARRANTRESEWFCIEKITGNPPVLAVAARHFRGTMLGLLEISRRMGIDPLGFFTDTASLPPLPGSFDAPIISPAPAFRYRGFFINQEDLLAGWKNPDGPIPLEVFDEIFLTILRLGGNMVLPGTYLSPDSPIVELASKRGLIAAQHHFQIVGTDVARLTPKQKARYSFVRHPRETLEVWRQAIRAFKHRETVWTLGYRGNNDAPFWTAEPNPASFTAARKGQVISAAIRAQLALLREELGTHDVPCVYYLYRENQALFQEGFVKVPPEVSVVWCDNGHGAMESYFRDKYEINGMGEGAPSPDTGKFIPAWPKHKRSADGIYYHVSFYDSCAPNRTQYVSPRKIQGVFRKAKMKGLNNYLLLNVGNMREFVLGIATVFDFARDPRPWLGNPNYHRVFLEQWCAARFGGKAARRATDAYNALYDAHWWWSQSPNKCCGDNMIRHLLCDMVVSVVPRSRDIEEQWSGRTYAPAPSFKAALPLLKHEAAASRDRWLRAVATATELLPDIPAAGRVFFTENLLIQARRGLGAISTLYNALAAVDLLGASVVGGRMVDARKAEACLTSLGEAKTALTQWEDALCAADRAPKWKRWSKSDRIVRPDMIREYLFAIEHLVMTFYDVMQTSLHDHLKRGTLCGKC